LEEQFEQLYIDIEMNSLEDAYINMAKAEEAFHKKHDIEVRKSINDDKKHSLVENEVPKQQRDIETYMNDEVI
jgi:hypothetical protein